MENFNLTEKLYQDERLREETITINERSCKWPDPINDIAYQGLVGELVKTIEPHTESDPVAILIQAMTAFGNLIGSKPHWIAEADIHPLKIYSVIVGETAKGRKGTSKGIVTRIFNEVDEDWTVNRTRSGLSSGEGLIWQVRDASGENEDSGVFDKRLWIREPEFGSVLRILGREGNSLSGVIRQAWDRGDLSTLTKNSPLKARGTHISITAHITQDELRKYLSQTEIFNGLANRFIWLCVRRSKILPEGGRIHEMDLTPMTDRIRESVQAAKSVDEIKRDEEAKKIWIEVYPELSEGKSGLIGAVLSRAEAQVMRLACIYALFDKSNLIRKEHLLSALALWDYAENSVRYIFRDKTGDNVADRILEALQESEDGLTRTQISNMFDRHKDKSRIDEAIELLRKHKEVKVNRQDTGGRPLERITREAKKASGLISHNSLISQKENKNELSTNSFKSS